MINLKASRKTPTIKLDCNPVTNVRIENPKPDGVTVNRSAAISYPNLDGGVPSVEIPNSAFMSVSPGTVSSFNNTSDIAARPCGAAEKGIELTEIPEFAALQRENAVLKLIIDIQHNNPLIVNKYIIADDTALTKMITLLCNASEVHLDADDVGTGCVTKKEYRKVHSIYVTVGDKIKNLKYDFPDVMKTLKDLHISTKFVW